MHWVSFVLCTTLPVLKETLKDQGGESSGGLLPSVVKQRLSRVLFSVLTWSPGRTPTSSPAFFHLALGSGSVQRETQTSERKQPGFGFPALANCSSLLATDVISASVEGEWMR